MSTQKQIKSQMFFIIKRIIVLIPELVRRLRAELMVRKVCKEEGLNDEETEMFVAILKCESGLDPKFEKRCPNGTYDYGICAYNSKWYIEKGLITKWEALNDPEKAVRLMIKQYRKGRLNDWLCFRNGLYRRFL